MVQELTIQSSRRGESGFSASLHDIRAERLSRRVEAVLAGPRSLLEGPRRRFAVRGTEKPARETENVSKVILSDSDGKVLLLKDARTGQWDVPGGHLHSGESYEDGARRETKEETGLEIGLISLREQRDNQSVFTAVLNESEPTVTLSHEHTDYKWVSKNEALALVPYWYSYAAEEAIRAEAVATMQKAVGQVTSLASALSLSGKHGGDFLAASAVILAAAIAYAYGQAAKKLAVKAKGEDRGESLTAHEEEMFAQSRALYLERFPKTVQERIELEAKRGKEQGESSSEMARRLHAEQEAIEQGYGSVVAETEATAITGAAQLRALRRAGYATCFWVTVGDDRECEICSTNESQGQKPLGFVFQSGHDRPPAHVNCRCWLEGASRR